VSITQSGLLMSKLEELVQRTPVVDQDRVAAIKGAIASGSYEIDAQRIADRLLKLERDLS
jgi:negative regulator of flagellin synthesis FlgM